MFENQRDLLVPTLKKAARSLGLDGAAFDQCLDAGKHSANVRADYELGEKMGVNSTPYHLHQRSSARRRPAVRSLQADHR